LAEGVKIAQEIIDSKKALKKLNELKNLSNSLGEL
jgi:anthranilate phosphoribosyltransferase